MDTEALVLFYEWGGHYLETEDRYVWIKGDDRKVYSATFRKKDDLTLSLLVERIRGKLNLEQSTIVGLSYLSVMLTNPGPTDIVDDDDLFGYVMCVDKERRRSTLHVHVSKRLELVPYQVSRTDDDEVFHSSVGGTDECFDVPSTDNEEVPLDQTPSDHPNEEVEYDLHEHELADEMGGPDESVDVERESQDSQFVDSWDDGLNFVEGQQFESKEAAQQLILRCSHEKCFRFIVRWSDTTRYVVRCREFENGCKWYVRIARSKKSLHFEVRKYNSVHTCSRANPSTRSGAARRGTQQMIAAILHEDYPGQLETPKPKSVVALVQAKVGVEVSYSTALRGRKRAQIDIRGTPEDSFTNLYSYLYMLEKTNPGTKTNVEVDEEQRFKYVFVALGACIEGFAAMRQVIIVDATHLKVAHKGVLIFATAQDPNRHHYPLALAVVDGENDASWFWFFNNLKSVIADHQELVFVSDRNQSLINAIECVYPNASHGYCTFHISQNVKAIVSSAKKEVVASKFREIAEIYTEVEFSRRYAQYREQYPQAATYLDKSVKVHKWARCYFPGKRYNLNTTNCAESLNAVFINARKYALLPMIDTIIAKWSEWFNKHRKECVSGADTKKLVPYVENVLHESCLEATKLSVFQVHCYHLEYTVGGLDGKNYSVNLRNKTCSCKCFDIDKYPCVHAMAAAMKHLKDEGPCRELRDYADLCSKYYWIEVWALAYTRSIYPVPHISEWIIPSEIQRLNLLPPKFIPRRGRGQVRRFPSAGESRSKQKSRAGTNLAAYFRSGSTYND